MISIIDPSFRVIVPFAYNAEQILERAGRTCYKSEDQITEDSAAKFVRMIIKSGHHSVLEHVSATVRFICDRGVTHELVRHRLAAFSQESTRYCKYNNRMEFIRPPWVAAALLGAYENSEHLSEVARLLANKGDISFRDLAWANSISNSAWAYSLLTWSEYDPETEPWVAGQARSVLPNSLKTEIVMTANLREWRHVFTLRTLPAAHEQMRQIMKPLLMEFAAAHPVLFEDIPGTIPGGIYIGTGK